jgi:predicted dehydrogenase
VAEQYQFQPLHAARLTLARSGLLGRVTQAQVSVAHGYHGLSLIRLFLDAGFESPTIRAREFVSPIVAGPDRAGPPAEERIVESKQVIAQLDFGDRLGVFDFTGDQYFSWFRSPRVLIRGERGEIKDTEVRYLKDFRTPVELELRRVNAGEGGNLEGYHHKGILAGVATCLQRMAEYVEGGPSFYGAPEASQDHYLNLLIAQAVASGAPVTAERQPWANQ